jgi:hypothetical protein
MRPVLERTFYNSLCIEVTDPFGNRIRFNQELPPEDPATTGPQLFSQDN